MRKADAAEEAEEAEEEEEEDKVSMAFLNLVDKVPHWPWCYGPPLAKFGELNCLLQNQQPRFKPVPLRVLLNLIVFCRRRMPRQMLRRRTRRSRVRTR